MDKKGKTLLILSIIFTVICVGAQILATALGVESLRLIYSNANDGSALGLIVLLPYFLLIAGVIVVLSGVSIGLTARNIAKNYKRGANVALLIINAVVIIANVVMFLMMILG